MYLAVYLFMNLGAFLAVDAIERQLKTDDVAAFAGLGRQLPFTAAVMALAAVTLDDKYAVERGRVYLTGTQARVRLPMMQRQRDAGDVPVTRDPHAILDDPEVSIVVEVIGGTDPARDLELGAFERGKHVVTANKELVAKEWKALHEAARLAKRELRFEAAVAAAVPVIAGMRGLGAVRPRVLRGLRRYRLPEQPQQK